MMILTEGMNLEDVPAVVDRMGAEAETVDRAAESPEMAVRMVVGQADGDRIHGDQAVVAQADLVQWDLQDHGDHRDFPSHPVVPEAQLLPFHLSDPVAPAVL